MAGHGGDLIEAYLARPAEGDGQPSVLVLHHMPGYDRASKEIVRTFARVRVHGADAQPAPPVRAGRKVNRCQRPRRVTRRRTRRAVPRRRAGRHRLPAGPARGERQGRRDRLLLGWPSDVHGRVHARRRCRRRLLRRSRRRRAGTRAAVSAARTVRQRRPVAVTRRRRRDGRRR